MIIIPIVIAFVVAFIVCKITYDMRNTEQPWKLIALGIIGNIIVIALGMLSASMIMP